jgi:hypothetical protein
MKNVTPALVALTAMMLTLPGCQRPMTQVTWEMGGMPSHDHPHQMWWQYQFVYHPQEQVYFEPYTGTYFWFAGDRWEEGSVLPTWIHLDPEKAEIVKLQEHKPYVQHFAVMKWAWPYSNPLSGSVDPYHSTPEAIAASEDRATMRMGTDSRETMTGDDMPWAPVSGTIELMEPLSEANEDVVDPFMGVDATDEMDATDAMVEMLNAQTEVEPQTADAMAELDSLVEDAVQEDESLTVVDPMWDGSPD